MLTYWLMFLLPASMALFARQSRKSNFMPFLFIGLFFALLIGLRYQVGGDWGSYLRHYDRVVGVPFSEVLRNAKDPAHQLLNWFMARWDFGVYGVNIIYGTVFMIGLVKFSRDQLYPWIAMTVAVPYMVIVVSMGYSRQGMALGLFMLAITYLSKENLKMYVVFILIATLFHKTAIILLPLGIFLYGKGIILRLLMIIPMIYGAWDLLLADAQSNLIYQYIDRNMQSAGAKIRVIMNLIPSLLFLMYRKKWKKSFNDYTFWFWVAIGSIVTMALVGVASTAVDRMALYFIPIQLAVYARLPYLARNQVSPAIMKVMIVVGYAAVLFVWLNYAAHAYAWVPYSNILFIDLF